MQMQLWRRQQPVKYNTYFTINSVTGRDLHVIPEMPPSWERELKKWRELLWWLSQYLMLWEVCVVPSFYLACVCKYVCAVARIRLVRRGRSRPVIGCWQEQKAGAQQIAEAHLRALIGHASPIRPLQWPWSFLVLCCFFCWRGDVVRCVLAKDRRISGKALSGGLFQASAPGPRHLIVLSPTC